MTYYALILVGLISIGFIVDLVRNKQYKPLVKSLITMGVAMLLALSFNATQLLATSEYAKESTRGNSPLKESFSGEPVTSNGGLTYDYITEYSYGLLTPT